MDSHDLPPALRAFLVTLVADAVRPAVSAALTDCLPELLRRAALSVYLTKQELGTLTGWSTRKIDYLVAERRIPVVRRGRTVLFRTEDVERYLEEGYVPAKDVRRDRAPQ
jgi:excisionase family DNA binding protein